MGRRDKNNITFKTYMNGTKGNLSVYDENIVYAFQ